MAFQSFELKEIERAYKWLSEYWHKPIRPAYHTASTMDEAMSILEFYGGRARILAGGIDLVGLMKRGLQTPHALVNIKPIKALKHISLSKSSISIGALTRISDLEKSPIIKSQYPLLFEAASVIGSPHIRNMATLAGNLCQETRCWYYRRSPDSGISYNCRRKDRTSTCFALNGENQYHALFGESECVSVCPSDMATVLCAMDAKIKTEHIGGGRTISINDFYSKFGNVLRPSEIILSVQIPRLAPGIKQRFLKFRIRKSIDFAIVSVASITRVDEKGVVSDSRIVLGGVSYEPYPVAKAAEILMGERITRKLVEKAAEKATSSLKPLSKNAYKIPIIKALIKRSILE
ncbi:hypothetical protein DRN98_06870 [Methanosarcinales archaeon]|nr:MAG: hypothetical protein DRN98_06870 [Methanosarcinales archaeon]